MIIGKVYIPRTVLVDSDSTSLDAIRWSCDGKPFRQENFVSCGGNGTGKNWAKGYYAAGGMTGRVMAPLRLEAEKCDRLQGFQVVHSVGGGTGSGLGARIMDAIQLAYPGRTVNTFTVVPSPTMSDTLTETYNTALSFDRLIGSADNTYFFDNRALQDVCSESPMNIVAPAYADLNHLVTQTMSGVTTSLRFTGDLNTDMKKCTANLVPYPKMHFFMPGFAPLTYRGQSTMYSCTYTVPELSRRLFAMAVSRCAGSVNEGQPKRHRPVVIAAAMTFRSKELCTTNTADAASAATNTVPCWLPNNIKMASYAVPSRGLRISGTIVANTTVVGDLFNKVGRRFSAMLAKKAYLHQYMDEGMTADDFQHALGEIETLAADYRSIEEKNADDDV